MALTVETVDLIFLCVVETLVREILDVATLDLKLNWLIMMHLNSHLVELRFTFNSLGGDIPDEMVVGE